MKYDLNKTIWEAPLHKSFASLSRALNINVSMLKYNLAKDRKLSLVLKIISFNKQ